MYETPETKKLLADLVKEYSKAEVVEMLKRECGYTEAEATRKISNEND